MVWLVWTDRQPAVRLPQLSKPTAPKLTIAEVAVVLSGRQAGKKVVVLQQRDEGTKERPYPHAIVAGIER